MKGETYMDFTEDGAWCFFADPRAVHYVGKHNRTYVGWLTELGDVMIGTYDHQGGFHRFDADQEKLARG